MTDLDPMAQLQVQQRIKELADEASQNTTNHVQATGDYYHAARVHKLAYARAYLAATGTVPEREAKALVETERSYTAMMAAEAVLKASEQAGRNIRAQLEACRTLAADIRDAVVHSTGRGG